MTTIGASGSASGLRRRSREMALQVLFQTEFLRVSGGEETASRPSGSEVLRRFLEDFSTDTDVADYGSEIYLGVVERIKEIDAVIQAHSAHWKTSRMGLVDLLVMRIAVFEMGFAKNLLSPGIVIDEAVEMAKTFGSTESSAFVNGILDHIARGKS
jgi:N utilization substance protein B